MTPQAPHPAPTPPLPLPPPNDEPSLLGLLTTALGGMKATLGEALKPEVTEQYPSQRPDLPWATKGQLYLKIEDCIACFKCAQACPSDCIRIDCVRVAPGKLPDTTDGHKRMFQVLRFDIDMGQCCYCGLCTGRSTYVPADKQKDPDALAWAEHVAACPSDCLNFYPRYENSTPDARNLLYHFSNSDLFEAKDLWTRTAPKERRSTHPEKANQDYPAPTPVPAPKKPDEVLSAH